MIIGFTINSVILITAQLFLVMIFSAPALAQDCTPESITLGNQQDVDNFQANHGPCDYVLFDLNIEGENILNLDGLSALTGVGENLRIERNPAIKNVDGLPALRTVGSLSISNNSSLANIDGLNAVTSIGAWLHIRFNDELREVNGLSKLISVGDNLFIWLNFQLRDINGLSGIADVGGHISVRQNSTLQDLNGLSGVTSVGNDLSIRGNGLLNNLDGLSALQEVQNVFVEDNYSLADCQGLVTIIDPIDDFEDGPGPGSSGIPDIADQGIFANNLHGCNSVGQILGAAPLVEINAGLNDAWFNPETGGQGYFITVFPNIQQIFLAWFTYDTERPAEDVEANLGDSGHRWLTALGPYADNEATLDIEVTRGGVFDASAPTPTQDLDGTIILEFSSCDSGTVTYDIPSIEKQGVIPIERIVLDNVASCYLLGTQSENKVILGE